VHADARKDVCAMPHNDLALAEASTTYGPLARGEQQQQVACSTALLCTAAGLRDAYTCPAGVLIVALTQRRAFCH
jgi:hypothetical protein